MTATFVLIDKAKTQSPDPNDWHKLPKGYKGPCPVCGLADRPSLSHRVADPGSPAKWIIRRKDKSGWKMEAIGIPKPPKLPNGPTDKIVALLSRAAFAVAKGDTMTDAAKAAEVSMRSLVNHMRANPDVWAASMEQAKVKIIAIVREQAGTDSVFENPDGFMVMARKADEWTTEAGKELFHHSSDELTLTQFYDDYYLPTCTVNLAENTKGFHAVILKRWRLMTGDPPLSTITTQLLAKWRDCLLKSRGQQPGSKMSPTTVKNFLRVVHAILMKAGPPGYRNHDAADLIPRVPWTKSPKAELEAPKIVSIESLNSVYRAAETMVTPEIPGLKAMDWWQALLCVTFNTGLRRRTLFSLRWEYVDLDRRVINIPPNRMKSRRFHTSYLNDTALEHLKRIQDDRELVFPWPYCREHFDKVFHRLQYEAGLPGKAHFGLHNLRKTFGTCLAKESPQAASLALGHAGMDVTIRHYINQDTVVNPVIDRIQQPAAFTAKV